MKKAIALTSLALLAIPIYLVYKKYNLHKNDVVDPWRGIVQF